MMMRQLTFLRLPCGAMFFAGLIAGGLAIGTEPTAPSPSVMNGTQTGPALVTSIVGALRDKVVPPPQGLVFDRQISLPDTKPSLVVLVPGLLALEDSMAAIQVAISKQSYATAVFRYSSHEGVKPAAALLAQELITLKAAEPNRPIILVTHSMGGLVARCCLEDPTTNPGNVSRLIMIAPPNHGSAIAGLTTAELAQKFPIVQHVGEGGLQTVDDAVGGLIGLAKEELCPSSTILNELNMRGRVSNVRYCIIAGSGGPVSGTAVEMSLLVGNLFLSNQPKVKAALDSAREIARLDEWTKGRGDGMVSIDSAKLTGVNDFVVLPFAHNSFGPETGAAADLVIAEVITRIK